MANLRGESVLFFGDEAVDDTGVYSNAGYPGAMVNVAILISNTGSDAATVTFQVAGGPPAAGRNPDMSTVTWHDLIDKADTANTSKVTLPVAAGASVALDLSPFSPPYLRLFAITGASDATTLEAVMVANG